MSVNKELIEICNMIFNPKNKCASCEGVFQYNEKVYRDYTNKEYCEVCYKEKYKEFI